MSDTPKTPPTAEQIAQIIDSNSVVIVKGERVLNPGRNIAPLILGALAPAERTEAVPDTGSEAAAFPMLWEIYHAVCHLTRDGEDTTGRRQWVADALAAFEAAFPQLAHGVKFQTPVAPTRAGALDAAGTKVAKLEATLRTISSLPRDSFDRAKYLADAALAAGDGDLK